MSPPTAIRSDRPPVLPMIRDGTPAADARRTTSETASGAADTTTRDADSPKSAAALLTDSVRDWLTKKGLIANVRIVIASASN